MADKDPADVPPIPTPEGNEPTGVPPVEPAPAAPAAPAAAAAPSANPYASAGGEQPNPYAAQGQPQPYNYGPYVPQPPKGLSITSMILGIVGVLLSFCWGSGFLLGVGAVITGHLAVKRQPYAKGMWLTGIITGYVTIAISLIALIALISLFAFSSSGYYNYFY